MRIVLEVEMVPFGADDDPHTPDSALRVDADRERPGRTVTTSEALMIFDHNRGRLAEASRGESRLPGTDPSLGQRADRNKHDAHDRGGCMPRERCG